MKRCKLIIRLLLCHFMVACHCLVCIGQDELKIVNQSKKSEIRDRIDRNYEQVKHCFETAYATYPTVPRGILEAVAFQYTHFSENLQDADVLTSDEAMPRTYSVMGLTYDGKGVFRENLKLVSQLSGISEREIMSDNDSAVIAYAAAFSELQRQFGVPCHEVENSVVVLLFLSELPFDSSVVKYEMKNFPMLSSLFDVYRFLSDVDNVRYGVPVRTIDFGVVFGDDFEMLNQKFVRVPVAHDRRVEESDYSQAIWNPASNCNYTEGRNGIAPSNVVVHYTSGTYAGAIAWFQNCSARVSAHYVVRSWDGQVTQMVSESDKAWHVGSENGYTIGIEHEAYGDVASYFTPEMYDASADLVRDICRRHPEIDPLRMFYRDTLDDGTALNWGCHSLGGSSACVQIRGHQHYPNQTHTDPGPYWDWNYYYKLVNRSTPVNVTSYLSGTFTDSGGMDGVYDNDERVLFAIHLPGVDSIELVFTQFDLEADFDFMWIYDGPSVFSPLKGRWNRYSPGRIVVYGEDLLVEFRSDCNAVAAGWVAFWQGFLPVPDVIDYAAPTTQILLDENEWISHDIEVDFRDSDDVALRDCFYQVIYKSDRVWTADVRKGFLCDNFDAELDTSIWLNDGHWSVVEAALRQQDVSTNAFLSARLNGDCFDAYLFDFYLAIVDGDTASFFFNCDAAVSQQSALSGYQVLLNKADHSISLWKWVEGTAQLLKRENQIYFATIQPYLYHVVWDRYNGMISIFRYGKRILDFQDPHSLLSHSVTSHIGWSSQHTTVKLDNVRVYGSRGQRVSLSVGPSDTCILHAQSDNGVSTCKLKSVVLDSVGLFSPLVEKLLLVDYTPPLPPERIVLAHPERVTTTLQSWNIAAQWTPSIDAESGVASYRCQICNPLNLNERWPWIDVGNQLSMSEVLSLTSNADIRIGVCAVDAAGLISEPSYSSPVAVSYGQPNARVRTKWSVSPNPASSYLSFVRTDEDDTIESPVEGSYACEFYDMSGKSIGSFHFWPGENVDVQSLPTGVYIAVIRLNGKVLWVDKIRKL